MNAPSVRHARARSRRAIVDQEVTVVGRFRGKNLYGDLPEAAGQGPLRLRAAVGRRVDLGDRAPPQGRGLRPERREPRRYRALARGGRRREGGARHGASSRRPCVRAGRPPAESAPEAMVKVPIAVPPPEVVFSAPTQGETDVEPDAQGARSSSRATCATTRSRAGSAIAYAGVSRAAAGLHHCATTRADACSRSPSPPRSRRSPTVQVMLKDTIVGTDGQPLGLTRWRSRSAADRRDHGRRRSPPPAAPADRRARSPSRTTAISTSRPMATNEARPPGTPAPARRGRRTKTSSTRLSTQFENGSGEVLAATRVDGLGHVRAGGHAAAEERRSRLGAPATPRRASSPR